MSKRKRLKEKTNRALSIFADQKKAITNRINKIKAEISEIQSNQKLEKSFKDSIAAIENKYKKNNLTHLIRLNSNYIDLKHKVAGIKSHAKRLNLLSKKLSYEKVLLMGIENQINSLHAEIKKKDDNKKAITPKSKKRKKKAIGTSVKSKRSQKKTFISQKQLDRLNGVVTNKRKHNRSSIGGSSEALTTKSSIWTVRKM